MQRQFDLIVLGTGSAGSGAAYACRRAGWEVAIVDSRPFGGTCALRGCDPKKVLVGAADMIESVRRMQGHGIDSTDPKIVWSDLIQFKRTFTDPVPESREHGYDAAGIATYYGTARFVGRNSVQVGENTLTARAVLIASGAKPKQLDIPGEESILTSDDFLELEELPKKIVFIGGGYISFEFAHVAARAGAEVTIVHRSSRPLFRFDPDLVAKLVSASREIGINIQLDSDVTSIDITAKGLAVIVHSENGRQQICADVVIHGGGRVPNIDDLDLEKAGVEYSERGIKVNQFLQSVSNPGVYAAGDCAESGPALTPIAGMESKVVAENLIHGNRKTLDYTVVPSVVFTLPPLASVGLLEAEAKTLGLEFESKFKNTESWYSSRRIREKHSAHKVLIEKESGRILGAHLLGSNADELINLFAAAMRFGLRSSDLKDLVYAYPTNSSNIPYMV
ncbi:NAD(P)/FAD-dependent oxidoreductase [bacterium]|nr:NAD(P)/FAD-dependent oxidoreductase [bacterium]